MLNGEVTYIVDGRRFTLGRGALMWMFPDQEHHLVNRTVDAEYYVGVFKPDMIKRACRSEAYGGLKAQNNASGGLLHTILDPAKFDLLRKIMDSMMEDALPHDVLNCEVGFGKGSAFRFRHGDPDELNAGLRHLLLLCWKAQLKGRRGHGCLELHPSVQEALRLINETGGQHTLGSLARHCGVSEAYLSRMFRRNVGVSLSRYRNSLRLGEFWERFHQAKRPSVAKAALAAGFGSYPRFYKVFVEQYGKGPRALLKDDGASEAMA